MKPAGPRARTDRSRALIPRHGGAVYRPCPGPREVSWGVEGEAWSGRGAASPAPSTWSSAWKQKRRGLVAPTAIRRDVLIRLNRAERVQELSGQNCQSRGDGQEKMDGAEVAVFPTGGPHCFLDAEGDVSGLPRSGHAIRKRSRLSHVNKRSKRRKMSLACGEHGLDVVCNRYEDGEVAGLRILADQTMGEARRLTGHS